MRRSLLPSLGELYAFDCAARHGSFTRAAEELDLTQSAVSRQVRQLEERLGVILFERVRQRVVLTDAGRLYRRDVERLINDLTEATQRVMAFGGDAGQLNLAVLPTFASKWLMPRLPDFRARHPDVTFNFATRLLPFDFAAEPFDAAIHYGSPHWAGAVAYHLMNEEIVPVCSAGYRMRQRLDSPAALSTATLLHQTTRANAWADWFSAWGISAPQAYRGPRFEQFSMIAQAAAAGLGAALLPRFLIEEELTTGRLEVLFAQSILSASAYYLVVPEVKLAQPMVGHFRDWLIAQAGAGL